MTTTIEHTPEEFMLIMNLMNAAIWHKTHCNADCNVSVFQMKKAAEMIYRVYCIRTGRRHAEIQALLDNMPII